MSNLTIQTTHHVNFRPVRVGSEVTIRTALKITKEQYEVLKDGLINDRFVEINGEMFSCSDITSVERIPEPPKSYPERWHYNSDEAFEAALTQFHGK